jgi:cullin 4
MSKVQGKRPGTVDLIDLTAPANPPCNPPKGARKLVIKNLRTSSRASELEQFYKKIWDDLEAALAAIFAGRQPSKPFETLYRGVEDICRRGKFESRKLAEFLSKQCDAYLDDSMLRSISAAAGSGNVDILRSVHAHWVKWGDQLVGRTSQTRSRNS